MDRFTLTRRGHAVPEHPLFPCMDESLSEDSELGDVYFVQESIIVGEY